MNCMHKTDYMLNHIGTEHDRRTLHTNLVYGNIRNLWCHCTSFLQYHWTKIDITYTELRQIARIYDSRSILAAQASWPGAGRGWSARTKSGSSNVPPRCPLISNKQGGGHLRDHRGYQHLGCASAAQRTNFAQINGFFR